MTEAPDTTVGSAAKDGLPSWSVGIAGTVAVLGLGAMVVLTLLDFLFREVEVGINNTELVKHLTLWIGLFGAVLASLKDRHLSIAVGEALRSGAWKRRFDILSRGGTIGILACLTFASVQHVLLIGGFGEVQGWLPLWIALLPMPLAFACMAVATFLHVPGGWRSRLLVLLLALVIGPVLVALPVGDGSLLRIVGILSLCGLAAVGMPLFAALGGGALLLFFFLADAPVASIPDAVYDIASETYLPSIPLFALAGVVLARGKGPDRLIRLVRAWTGWLPGGASVAAILACAFFTAITGASGVTILALGGLLLPVLLAAGHGERFTLGLLTGSGSVGLLFPPSIPVILYAVRGHISVVELFLAGVLPGILLILLMAGYSAYQVRGQWAQRPGFDLREAMTATRLAWGDILLPVLIVWAIFGGYMGIVEASALAALWAVILEVGIHRNLGFRKGLPATMVETCFLVGALIAVIALAFGLFAYIVTVQLDDRIVAWVTTVIHSKWVFLLVLNLLLLVVGAMMDIFSAIILVVPLVVPLAAHYEIGLAHIGIVFLANLELGYLTPPVGMNLFISALTFDRPLLKIWRASLPFLAIVAAWVLLVTYVPWISQGFGQILANLLLGG